MRHGPADERKVQASRILIASLLERDATLVLAAQALAETHHVLVKKGRISKAEASRRVAIAMARCIVVPTDADLLADGLALSARHDLQTFDAIILAAAASVGCETLYSEDMAAGFSWRGVTVVNPFA